MIDRRALLKQAGAVMAALGTASVFDPLRVYAHREAVYITCTGASLSGRQADLLDGPASEAAGAPASAAGVEAHADVLEQRGIERYSFADHRLATKDVYRKPF